MGENKFERFGKYLILDHLVDGGMAKICRARFLGEQANKIVAVKMVQPQFSKDPAFVQMFEDELKVTFGLLHPNIAQMYDYGIVSEQLYTAMEYVDGANLKQYLDRLREKNFVFPVEISTYITSQVCQALHYAHTFTDKLTGKPFNIIHRDISPHNIMLTYDGAVKVIDFGIAKADSNSEATQAGTIKGKLSYLAPEYLDGLQLDHRYDQFAVGITLWELLCSRKLFKAPNDLAVLKQIQACKIPPPSSINPNVPKELDIIVLKALAKDRNQRFENMDKFNRALVKFLYSNYPDFNATDLGYFAKQLFKEEIKKDKEKFVEYGKIDIKPYLEDLARDGKAQESSISGTGSSLTKKIEIDFGLDKKNKEDLSQLTEGIELDRGGRTKTAAARKFSSVKTNSKIQLKSNGQKEPSLARRTGGTSATTKVRRRSSGSSAGAGNTSTRRRVAAKKAPPQKSSGAGMLPLVGSVALAVFLYTQADLVKEFTGFDIKALIGVESEVVGAPERKVANQTQKSPASVAEQNSGYIRFSNLDSNMRVFINGRPAKTEGIKAFAPLNKKVSVTVRKTGYKKHTFENIYLTEQNFSKDLFIPDLEKEVVGLLSTSQNFTSGSKLILNVDGEVIERQLPFSNMRIPAGRYEAIIANPLLNTERKEIIEIKENRRFLLE